MFLALLPTTSGTTARLSKRLSAGFVILQHNVSLVFYSLIDFFLTLEVMFSVVTFRFESSHTVFPFSHSYALDIQISLFYLFCLGTAVLSYQWSHVLTQLWLLSKDITTNICATLCSRGNPQSRSFEGHNSPLYLLAA